MAPLFGLMARSCDGFGSANSNMGFYYCNGIGAHFRKSELFHCGTFLGYSTYSDVVHA